MKVCMLSSVFKQGGTLEQCIRTLAKFGYDGVEIRSFESVHVPPDASPERVEQIRG